MPELPEVEVVRRGLEQHVLGRHIRDVDLRGHRVARRHPGGASDLADRVRDTQIQSIQRRGKYLWFVLSDGRSGDPSAGGEMGALVVHLGMSGQFRVCEHGMPEPRHTHAVLTFDDGGPSLVFADQRTFGGFAFSELGAHGIPALIAHIAPDPFDPAYDQRGVVRRLVTRNSAIKRGLLDQGLVSGIGNIYADEALWRARVHGERMASTLSKAVLGRILDQAREVMGEALAQGGTSFDALYVNVNGESGYFDLRLRAYGQEGRPCERCGTPIRREHFMNRSSFFCPRCQPPPRSSKAAST